MKEELSFKHIAPYLPYGLEVREIGNDLVIKNPYIICSVGLSYARLIKPLLRPMSELFENIVHNDKVVCVAKLICEEGERHGFEDLALVIIEDKEVIQDENTEYIMDFEYPYNLESWITEILNEHHFDWRYDLILKGLAELIRDSRNNYNGIK